MGGGARGQPGDKQPGTPPATIDLRLLGGFAIAVAGHPVADAAWGASRKARSLVKLLALAPGRQLTRDQVIEALWPDLDLDAGVNNFHRTLHAARRALAPAEIALRRQVLTLAPAGCSSDVADFEQAVAAARRAPSAEGYEAALARYTGALLPEDRYEDWAAGRREALHGMVLALLRDLAEIHEARREWAAAIVALERLVAAEPTHEEGHVALMRAQALGGRRREAVQQFARLRDILRRELDAEPDAAARRLHAAILAGQFPAVEGGPREVAGAAGLGGRDNLPAQLTSFVGRGAALAALRDLLRPDGAGARLVTLTGAGGCGKTRLALRVAADLAAARAYPDGVWLVELAALAEPALVADAVAAAVGVRGGGERPALDLLVEQVRERRLLLVLDNCEHLIAACAAVAAALVRACPHLRLLATSRRPLGLAGEVLWRVPSLDLPGEAAAPEVLAANEAVRLFVERARLARPAFALDPRTAPAVARICRRLDGLPLAIELAAARAALLSPEQLAARLDDRFRLLTGGDRAAPRRQHTLRAAVDWSYDLLAPAERALLARLAVFAGGATLETIEAVCGASREAPGAGGHGPGPAEVGAAPDAGDLPSAPFATLDALASLVDHSLVTPGGADPGGELRFGMLETIHAYAAERLARLPVGEGDAEHWRGRHAAHFLALAERAGPYLTGPQQAIWLARLARELPNFRAALAWYARRGDAAAGLRLAVALGRLWHTRSYLREGRQWLEEAFAGRIAAVPPAIRASALYAAGVLAHFLGDDARAIAQADASLPLFRDLANRRGEADALNLLGLAHRQRGDPARAGAYFAASLALWRALGEARNIGMGLINLASLEADRGAFADAIALTEEALPLLRAAGDDRFLGIAIANLGGMHTLLGAGEAARPLLADALRRCRATGDWRMLTLLLQFVAILARGEGRDAEAVRLLGAEESLRAATGVTVPPILLARRGEVLDGARAALGAGRFAAARAEGQSWAAAETIDRALALLPPRVPAQDSGD